MIRQILYYPGTIEFTVEFQFQSSGSYFFRPNGTLLALLVGKVNKLITYHHTHITHTSPIHHSYRCVEIDQIMWSTPIDDGVGKTITSFRITSKGLQNDGIFWPIPIPER